MFVCLKVLVEDEEAAVSLVEGKHLSDDVQLKPPKKKVPSLCEFVSFWPIKFKKKTLRWAKAIMEAKNKWKKLTFAINGTQFHFPF